MSIGAIFIGLALLILSIPIVAGPVLNKRRERFSLRDKPEAISSSERYQAALSALFDLDFDHQLGIVSDEDFSGLRAQLMAEAAEAREGKNDEPGEDVEARIEAAIRARRGKRTSTAPTPNEPEFENSLTCYHCGIEMEEGDKFCAFCGSAAAPACPHCGRQSNPGDRFCAGCGVSFQTEVVG